MDVFSSHIKGKPTMNPDLALVERRLVPLISIDITEQTKHFVNTLRLFTDRL